MSVSPKRQAKRSALGWERWRKDVGPVECLRYSDTAEFCISKTARAQVARRARERVTWICSFLPGQPAQLAGKRAKAALQLACKCPRGNALIIAAA